MGLLSRLRAWIGTVFGGDERGESPAEGTADDESGADESDADGSDAGDEPTGLDPSAATETRTAATDDAVDALRDVRRSHDGAPAGGETEVDADEVDADGVDADGAGGDDRDAP
ncbi:hypothetical protein DJ82_02805 [Halorubrum sp. Ib24]|uniref:hypothetical protein n=1 Tax=unclassified Halorubrum TaxID=2642239 RepID=UPI000B98DEB9|nr:MULTISPECIES: hypothetical protein [unclassified Halorubrum]OYR42331.1 hypothetical protein DJ82_02805 [Halorubrum sp. Ib24]OYR49798.1 hypothetical protein DJ75_00935 [Halorubrum sp. Eb13]OYR55289.1 hypothetical protein DJ73_02560 [Halorubrum sp. Ea1]